MYFPFRIVCHMKRCGTVATHEEIRYLQTRTFYTLLGSVFIVAAYFCFDKRLYPHASMPERKFKSEVTFDRQAITLIVYVFES